MQDRVESYITRTTCTGRATSLFINMAKTTCCTACLPFNPRPHAGSDTYSSTSAAQTACAAYGLYPWEELPVPGDLV